jgi:hypothetical protein
MKAADVTHINLLQRTGPTHAVGWALAGILAATAAGLVYHGAGVMAQASQALQRRDEAARQLKEVQARLAALNSEQVKSAHALALRAEVEQLKPQAQGAQALLDALQAAQGGKTEDFGRAMASLAGLGEPGLWLTALTVSEGGRRVEVQGQARNGASVLSFARRVNDALRPLALRLDSHDMQPGAPTGPGGDGGAFRLRIY